MILYNGLHMKEVYSEGAAVMYWCELMQRGKMVALGIVAGGGRDTELCMLLLHLLNELDAPDSLSGIPTPLLISNIFVWHTIVILKLQL